MGWVAVVVLTRSRRLAPTAGHDTWGPGVIELPKISHQESVEVVKIIPQERISERMYERSEVIVVPKISY